MSHTPAPTRWPHIAAILAGGSSRRMGAPKAALRLHDGRTMIEHVHDALAARCARVVIVGETDMLPALHRVTDLRPGIGPLGGIEALLASGLDEHYLLCPCDLPRISHMIIDALTDQCDSVMTVVRIAGENAPRALPVRLAAAALPVVQRQADAGEYAVHRLIPVLDPNIVSLPADAADALFNVNTPEDAACVQARNDAPADGASAAARFRDDS